MDDAPDNGRHTAQQKQEIRRVLLDYLAACPTAADTMDGIARFWLPRQRVRAEIAVLQDVLSELVGEGLLEVSGAEGNRRYRLLS